MADADTNIALLASAIGAGSAIIASFVTSVTYYYIEKKKSENETRMHLRDERKTLYANLFNELSNFQKDYLQRSFPNWIDPFDIELCEEYEVQLNKTCLALRTIMDNFATKIELTQNLEIGKMLRETYRFLYGFMTEYEFFRWSNPDVDEVENPIPKLITSSDVKRIEDELGEIIRLMRAELIPFQEEKKKESQREYWWEMAKAKHWWRFWK